MTTDPTATALGSLAHRMLPSALDPSARAGVRHRSADVVVVGAGLAGLVAANRIVAAGRSVIVLEARPDRVGGRLESATHSGHSVDLGGAWIGAAHTRAAALARDLGIPTWPTHAAGQPVVIHRGKRMRGRGYKLRHLLATLDARRVGRRLERLTSTVDTEAPWSTPGAEQLDAQTLGSWLAAATRLRRSHATVAGTLTNLIGTEPGAVSLLHALFYLRSSGGMHAMLGDEGGAQQGLVYGGAQALAAGLAERLPYDALELGAPACRIVHGPAGVSVQSVALTVDAGAAIVALAPALAGRIAYSPALPSDRDRLTSAMPHGDVTKAVMLYDSAFWREDGLSGEAWGEQLPFSFSYDMSAPDGRPGVLTLFFVGERARRFRSLTAAGRRAALMSALECCFGPRATSPIACFERDWAAEEWTRGAYGGYMPPGVWTRYGSALRAPIEPLYWAGSETAVEHAGYMEGAIESGERTAAEVLARAGAGAVAVR
jgi:monoamine oxidase